MTEARVPQNKKVWEPIDIFLFSNGQQYTPPRKYHLHGDELNLWESTLGYLARCQLGSTTSHIHLYSIQGRKIETPLELVDGTAYVAVATRDKFIDSGYDKYIVKATRSWEKRQARKCDIQQHNPDEAIDDSFNIINNSDDINSIKAPEENFTTESLMNASMKQQSSRKYRVFGSTQGDKNRLSLQPSTLKKSTIQSAHTPARRSSIKTKDNLPKRFVKPLRPSTTMSQNSNGKTNVTNIPCRAKEFITSRNLRTQEKKTSDVPNVSTNKYVFTETTTKNDVIKGKETVVSNIIMRTDDNEPDAIVIQKEHVGVQQGELYIPIDEEVQTVVIDDDHMARIVRRTSSKTISPDVTSNMVISKHKPVRDNYITFMNKGDVVSLKLMIEIKCLDNHKTVYRTVRKSQSLTNVFKPEKGLQVNTEDELLIRSQTLHSVIDNEISQNTHLYSNDKVVVISCDCGDEIVTINKTEDDVCSESSSKKYVVLVPKHDISSGMKLYTIASKNNEILVSPKRNNSVSTYKKTREEISIEKIAVVEQKEFPELLINDNAATVIVSKKNLPHEKEDSECLVSNRRVTLADSNINPDGQTAATEVRRTESKLERFSDHSVKEVITDTNASRALDETIIKIVTSETSTQEKGYIVVRAESTLTSDKWTQTDIDDLVLEARLHDDGHYTFHLPSLNALKTYNLS